MVRYEYWLPMPIIEGIVVDNAPVSRDEFLTQISKTKTERMEADADINGSSWYGKFTVTSNYARTEPPINDDVLPRYFYEARQYIQQAKSFPVEHDEHRKLLYKARELPLQLWISGNLTTYQRNKLSRIISFYLDGDYSNVPSGWCKDLLFESEV